MSFLSDTVLSGGSTRLHVEGNQETGGRVIRKSKSHGGFLSPLTRLVRNPVQSLGAALTSQYTAPFQEELDQDAGRKQILYLRLKNVCTRAWCFDYHMLMARHRPRHTTNGRLQRPTSIFSKGTMPGRTETSPQNMMQHWSRHASKSWTRPGLAAT